MKEKTRKEKQYTKQYKSTQHREEKHKTKTNIKRILKIKAK